MNHADSDPQSRTVGTIIGKSTYSGDCSHTRGPGEAIVEVLWNTGFTGWILLDRVKKITNNSKCL
jgi:hypothetical protein